MACAVVTNWGNIVKWTTPNQKDISHVEVYRRTASTTAAITTADIVAKVPNVPNTEQAFPYFFDLFTAINTTTDYWYWAKSVAFDGQRSTGSHPTITADRSSLSFIADASVMQDPTGLVNRTDSVMSFTTATRTFSISPAVTSFDYYINGEKFTVTAADTVVLENTTALTMIYYDSATLSQEKNPSDGWISSGIRTLPFVSILYYSTADSSLVYFGEERHGLQMDGSTHSYLHFANGLAYLSGLGLQSITANQSGDLDPHAQFGVVAGGVADEDIYLPVDTVASTVGLPILYREGLNGEWRKLINSGFSVYTTAAGSRLTFNDINSGNWTITQIANNDFGLCHVFASTEKDTPMLSIMGQADYGNLNQARSGATTEINSLLLGSLPSPEMRPIATVIFQTSNGYANSVESRIRTTDSGEDYIDWRTTALGRGVAATDHGALAGLGDDDHAQYLLLDGRTAGQTVCGATTLAGGTSGVTINNFIELTAVASNPATPTTGGAIRVFAKATAGVTKLMYIDTAGTTTQL